MKLAEEFKNTPTSFEFNFQTENTSKKKNKKKKKGTTVEKSENVVKEEEKGIEEPQVENQPNYNEVEQIEIVETKEIEEKNNETKKKKKNKKKKTMTAENPPIIPIASKTQTTQKPQTTPKTPKTPPKEQKRVVSPLKSTPKAFGPSNLSHKDPELSEEEKNKRKYGTGVNLSTISFHSSQQNDSYTIRKHKRSLGSWAPPPPGFEELSNEQQTNEQSLHELNSEMTSLSLQSKTTPPTESSSTGAGSGWSPFSFGFQF